MARRRDSVADELEDEGIPGMDDSDPAVEGQMPPRDHPRGASEFGVTAREQSIDEPIGERTLRERPDTADVDEEDADDGAGGVAGRTVAPDEGTILDEEKDEVAHDTADRSGMSAEEEAVHETEHP